MRISDYSTNFKATRNDYCHDIIKLSNEDDISSILKVKNRNNIGLIGLGRMCSHKEITFVVSNPTEVDVHFKDVKFLHEGLEAMSLESDMSCSPKKRKPEN